MRDPRFLKQLFAANIVDNAIINPIIYWPVFYSFKEICFADDSDTYVEFALAPHFFFGVALAGNALPPCMFPSFLFSFIALVFFN